MYSNIIRLEEVDSTNTYALNHIEDIADKTIVIADKQTVGRGRFQRKWVSDIPGNVYLSIILKPENNDLAIENISQYLSLIVCRMLDSYGLKSFIKWPNDILINDKKIGGILCETSFRGSTLRGIVLGLGINVNMTEKDLARIDQPATSFKNEFDKEYNMEEIIEKLWDEFFNNYDQYCEKGFSLIKNEFIERCFFLKKKITIESPQGISKGLAKRINNNGALILEMDDGKEKKVTVGDMISII